MLIPPKGGPPPHSHAKFQEAFYVIEGEIEVVTKEWKYTMTKGSHINIAFNGPVHKFVNKTGKIVRPYVMSYYPSWYGKNVPRIREASCCKYFLPPSQLTSEEQKPTSNDSRKIWPKIVSSRLFRLKHLNKFFWLFSLMVVPE